MIARLLLLAVALLAVSARPAQAGEFRVGSCQADVLNFSTRPFEDFATRGMRIRRACDPDGAGLRGLITANVLTPARVRRGARAVLTINAPYGTRFTTLRWAGTLRRRDCGYALRLYADAPDVRPISIKNVRPNEGCPRPRTGQSAQYRSRTYDISRTTRIVQRVACVGSPRKPYCSGRGSNYIRTFKVLVGIADELPPAVSVIGDTALARGEWVSGQQPLNYDANDNVGVRVGRAVIGGQGGPSEVRSCVFADGQGTFADRVPCANGRGQIGVDTKRMSEGTLPLVVQAEDPAGNVGVAEAGPVRIDNTPPGRVDVAVEGGDGWRNRNDFALTWANAPEADRAPVAAAIYKVCSADGGSCARADRAEADVSRLAVQAPGPGEWKVSVWRRDAAGNEAESNASVPVTLRYDPEPPQLGFEQSPASDPTLVSVAVTDKVSGLASGTIEISREGSGSWQTLATETQGSRLLARIDDAAMAPGNYQLRARASDRAHNEGSTDRRLDGQLMTVTLPLRVQPTLRAGVVAQRVVRRTVRRGGRRRTIRRRVTVLKPAGRAAFGRQVEFAGLVTNRDGHAIPGLGLQVLARDAAGAEQPVRSVQTDASGRFRYVTTATASRTLRFVYPGSPTILPTSADVALLVPAASTLGVSRRRVLNGQAVTFAGRVRTVPVAGNGKLVELQVRLSGGWQTFRTTRTDNQGRWAVRYRFRRTRGLQRFVFRARLPAEAGYPFETGASPSVSVLVRGR